MSVSNEQNQQPSNEVVSVDENHVIAERREKLKAIRDTASNKGGVAFPNDFKPLHKAADLIAAHADKENEAFEASPVDVVVAGRMMLKRVMGKASFATIQDGSGDHAGSRIQLYIGRDVIGEEVYEQFKHWDLGDFLGATGHLFKTKTGELSIKVTGLRLLTKSLRPLPEKFHGLQDQEVKYRQRYVDLITSEDTRATFIARSKVVSAIRNFMIQNEFLEVETPMLHPIPGGASAKPFITHHNALDMQMYMRIAPELYLKRLVVGGFERVFEINRNFRNEGLSVRHNPEFTMMEFYAAYTDYQWLMDFTENCIRAAAIAARGTAVLEYQGRELDLSKPFQRLTIVGAIQKYAPQYTLDQLNDMTFLRAEILKHGTKPFDHAGLGALQLALFEETAESQLWDPTYIIDYPENGLIAITNVMVRSSFAIRATTGAVPVPVPPPIPAMMNTTSLSFIESLIASLAHSAQYSPTSGNPLAPFPWVTSLPMSSFLCALIPCRAFSSVLIAMIWTLPLQLS